MTREELQSFGERYLAGEPVAEWPAGIADIVPHWFDYRNGTTKLKIVFHPEEQLPGVVYDDFGQPDPEKTEEQRRWRQMEREWDAIRVGGRKGALRGGRDSREDKTARRHELLRAAVGAYRAEHPSATYSDIAKVLQPKYRRIRDDADTRATKRAIDALRKEIKRLETPREETPPRRRSRAESSRELPAGITWLEPLDPYEWAIKRRWLEIEQGLARIHEGGAQGRLKARKQKRDRAAHDRELLLAAVKAHRRKYPGHGRPAIAEALLPKFGRSVDHADHQDRARAVRALTKKIERLEKSLDA